MSGSIRVINKRGGQRPDVGETAVVVDRTHPVLGNPYVLRDPLSREQRDIVCDRFERMAEHDMRTGGPISRAVLVLADRVRGGERIALQCWCKPRRSHADWIADRVRLLAKEAP